MTKENQFARDLIDFIYASPSKFQVVRNIKAALLKKGFKELDRTLSWNIESEGRYFTTKNESSIIAFIVGSGDPAEHGFKIIAAHTDSPGLTIKPSPEIYTENYVKLNVETYGGAILNTWLDRPLALAGRVCLAGNKPLQPDVKYLNINKPLFIIPNLAIHFNREINEGKSYNKQIDMLPLMCLNSGNKSIKKLIAENIHSDSDLILDYDLSLYEYEKGCLVGANNEFISCGKIDDLAMVHAGVGALFNSESSKATNMMVCFDNEEVGSMTKQGAASPFLKDVMKRITWSLNTQRDAFFRAKTQSFGISADMAHAVHPNFPEKHDPVLKPKIDEGPVIKINANQKYATDGISSSIFEMICRKAGVPYQKYTNRSDIAGGSTLGSIVSSQLDIRMVDIGNPMLAMHSIRELAGVQDQFYIKTVFEQFYKL